MKRVSPWECFIFLAFFGAAFAFRLYFGLHCPSVIEDDDEVQTYLIGLKSYTTQTWPYFGTDMQGGGATYKGQMAGALLGWLVRLPLQIWPDAVSPFVFLNLLSLLALGLLGWYCRQRTPGLSIWCVWLWVLIAPWTTHFSTSIINQSYALVGAVLFCVGFMESLPTLRVGFLRPRTANVLMGFGFLWIAELHMSWVMFVPLAAWSFLAQWRDGAWKEAFGFGLLGALPLLALVVPTYLAYGFSPMGNLAGYSSPFNPLNPGQFAVVLARYLSFACFELPRFLGEHTPDRMVYLFGSPWLAAPGFLLWGAGILQALGLLAMGFETKGVQKDWGRIRFLALFLFFVIYFSFWFSVKPPSSHRYPEALPFVMVYSFYCWERLAREKVWRWIGVVFLAVALYFQVGYAVKTARSGVSVYSQYGDRMERAIQAKDYRLLAERRPYALY